MTPNAKSVNKDPCNPCHVLGGHYLSDHDRLLLAFSLFFVPRG